MFSRKSVAVVLCLMILSAWKAVPVRAEDGGVQSEAAGAEALPQETAPELSGYQTIYLREDTANRGQTVSGSETTGLCSEEILQNRHYFSYTACTFDFYQQISALPGVSDDVRRNAVVLYREYSDLRPDLTTVKVDIPAQFSFYSASAAPTDTETKTAASKVRQSVQIALDALLRDDLSLFWVDLDACRIQYHYTGKRDFNTGSYKWAVDSITLTPAVETAYATNTSSCISALNSAVKNFVVSGNTTYDKLRSIHDTLCKTVRYQKNDYAYSAYGGLVAKACVCEGYARAFKMLCDREEIPCVLVSGTGVAKSGVPQAHMWNYVRMDDYQWYAVDVTWDDQNDNVYYDFFLCGANTVASHFAGKTFAESHIPDGDFSGSGSGVFAYPVLSSGMYTGEASALLTGDVNGDHVINASDALLTLQQAAQLLRLSGDEKIRADVNQDGNINAEDALQILRYAARIISGF